MTMMNWQQDDRFAIRSVGGDASTTLVIPVHQGGARSFPRCWSRGTTGATARTGSGRRPCRSGTRKRGRDRAHSRGHGLPTAGDPPSRSRSSRPSLRFLLRVRGPDPDQRVLGRGRGEYPDRHDQGRPAGRSVRS